MCTCCSLPLPLDEAVLVAVDQDVVDRRVLEQRLQRAEADHLVDDVVDQRVELGDVDRHALLARLFRDEIMHLAAHLVLGQALQRDEVDLLDQHAVDARARIDAPCWWSWRRRASALRRCDACASSG